MKFLDQAKIYIKAGDGGHGLLVFVEKNLLNLVVLMVEMVEMVVIILDAERNLNTLIDFRFQQHLKLKG